MNLFDTGVTGSGFVTASAETELELRRESKAAMPINPEKMHSDEGSGTVGVAVVMTNSLNSVPLVKPKM